MPEYAGYQKRNTIDWLSLAKGVKTDIDQGLKAREERKAADESLFTDVTAKINEWQSTQNKQFNEVVFNGLEKAKGKALEWNRQLKSGEITRAEYQRRINNLNDSFGSFSTATKNFDQYVVGVNQMKDEGKIGSLGMIYADINTRLMNIGTKEMEIGDNGDFFVVDKVDGSVQNVRNYTNMNNVAVNKFDLASRVDSVVSKWDPVVLQELKARGATVLTEDPRINKAYNDAKSALIGSLVDENNPEGVVSLLLDNSDLDYNAYYTADDARKILDKAVQNQEMSLKRDMTPSEINEFKEKYFNENMIQIVQDNDGNYKPRITDKMISDAKMVANNEIEQQLGFKKEEERGFAPSGGGGGGGRTSGKEEAPTKAGWELSQQAIDNVPIGATSASDASGILTQLGSKNPKYEFKKVKWSNGKTGIAVFEKSKSSITGEEKLVPKQNILNARDLAPYIYGTSNVDKALTMWDEANKTYGGTTSTKTGAGDALFRKK